MALGTNPRLMGLLGEHISYSWSPLIHNPSIASLGIDAVYLPLSLSAARLPGFLEAAWEMGAIGFNVTAPHKATVATWLQQLGGGGLPAVNTLYRGPRGWEGASTDGAGWVSALGRVGRRWESFERVVFLGGGGAVVAILDHVRNLAPTHQPAITVLRRSSGAEERLIRAWSGRPIQFGPLTMAAVCSAVRNGGSHTLLVQATSAPHAGDNLERLVPALDGFGGVLVDLAYHPASALVAAARARGLVVQDGVPMLIEQALASQHLWWGRSDDYAAVARRLRAIDTGGP